MNFPSDGLFHNAVQALPDGSVRMKTILDDTSAPEAFEYTFGESGEYVLTEAVNQDGEKGVAILNSDQSDLLAMVEPAWAKDATGRDLESHFEIRDNVLVQHVSHQDENVQYPVIADPYVWGDYYEAYWYGGTIWFKRGHSWWLSELSKGGVSAIAAGVGAMLGGPIGGVVGAVSGAVIGAMASSIYSSMSDWMIQEQGYCIGTTWRYFHPRAWSFYWKNQYCY